MKIAELAKRVNFFVSGVILVGALMFGLFLIQLGFMSSDERLSIINYGRDLSDLIATYCPQLLLTVAFSLALMYAVIGAIIAGSVPKKDLSPCFMCLFSTAVPFSMMGLGASWLGHMTPALWLLVGVVAFLTITSYCAQHFKELWPHYSNEPQPSGNES